MIEVEGIRVDPAEVRSKPRFTSSPVFLACILIIAVLSGAASILSELPGEAVRLGHAPWELLPASLLGLVVGILLQRWAARFGPEPLVLAMVLRQPTERLRPFGRPSIKWEGGLAVALILALDELGRRHGLPSLAMPFAVGGVLAGSLSLGPTRTAWRISRLIIEQGNALREAQG
jgi:hypothetical protein